MITANAEPLNSPHWAHVILPLGSCCKRWWNIFSFTDTETRDSFDWEKVCWLNNLATLLSSSDFYFNFLRQPCNCHL